MEWWTFLGELIGVMFVLAGLASSLFLCLLKPEKEVKDAKMVLCIRSFFLELECL